MFQLIIINLLAITFFKYSYSKEIQVLIWIQHTDVTEYYLSVRQAAEMLFTSSSSISNLSVAEKFKLCQADLITFKNTPRSMQDIKLDDMPIVENDIRRIWKNGHNMPTESFSNSEASSSQQVGSALLLENLPTISEPTEKLTTLLLYTVEYAVVLARISSMVHKLNVLICAISTPYLFIADGYLRDTFYRIELSPVEETFFITGLLEPMPIIDEELLNDDLRMQINFMEEYRWAERMRKKKSLCKLNSLTKFRLCSSVFVSWTLQKNVQLLWQNVIVDNDVCIQNISIQLPLLTLSPKDVISGVDLIPCAINKEFFEPQFYLTSNQFEVDSVYVIHSTTNKTIDEVDYIEYFLDLHVKNIASLH